MSHKYLTLLAEKYKLVLGSGSPRRVKLLKQTGVAFEQVIPNLEEDQLPEEPPYEYAERLACDKALLVAKKLHQSQIVIGCDTIVVLDGKVLGKPLDEAEAFRTLLTLAGKQHTVCTAMAMANCDGIIVSGCELTDVRFNEVTDEQIKKYIATGEPMDKAGAYGIQGMGAFLVDSLTGNLDTVIGFPRKLLESLAQKILESDK